MDIQKILSDERTSQANFGLKPEDFTRFLPFFRAEVAKFRKRGRKKNFRNAGRKPVLDTDEKRLAFTLYYLKTYPTFDVLGGIFGLDRSTSCTLAHQYVDILLKSLRKAGVVPKEKIKNRDEFVREFPTLKVVIADGTERRRRRPKNKHAQKEFYSGKKNSTQ